jgi:hypothetical protein
MLVAKLLSSIVFPDGSFQDDGAKKSCPSSTRRTVTHRARRAFSGGIIHAPNRHE